MRADLQIWTLVGPLSLRPTTNNDDNPSLLHHIFFFFNTVYWYFTREWETLHAHTGQDKGPKKLKGHGYKRIRSQQKSTTD